MKQSILTVLFLIAAFSVKASSTANADEALQMLADFTPYLYNNYETITDRNSAGQVMATFRGENTYGNNEQGVRHNADLSMICAFLCRYANGKVTLPQPASWASLAEMAHATLTYSLSTHKANRLYPCKGIQYWGSTSQADHSWESSLWAMSVAYSAFFQWDKLNEAERQLVYQMLKAECNYELERSIPTGFEGDTKAEENGWECDVLAVTLGLFPDDPLAPRWFDRLRRFAINSYSHPADSTNNTVIDPAYDLTTVAQLFEGANLYSDLTLQNHNYFHTSYQNVVVQELGEAALALKLFQRELYGKERWKTNALMNNVMPVMNRVLYGLALTDGELAMPNGNDWSLFLYDQLTSYSTAACFLQDPDALLLEQQALTQIRNRQRTTPDGSWLLRADVGARRMGVEGHRVMMTWLMHHVLPTRQLRPTSWTNFLARYGNTNIYPCQDVITASSDHRFVCFSWSKGLRNISGYFAPTDETKNNIIVPLRVGNTGNFIGWYDVEGKRTDATDDSHEISFTENNSFAVSGTLRTNEGSLSDNYLLFASPNNLVIYFDMVRALADCTIQKERGGLLGISTDPFTATNRTLYLADGQPVTSDGHDFQVFNSQWANIDGSVAVLVANQKGSNQMAFGEQKNNNSILTSRFYAAYSDSVRTVTSGEVVDIRLFAYYSNINPQATQLLRENLKEVSGLPRGWSGYQVNDTDGTPYLFVYNFTGKQNKRIDLRAVQRRIKPRVTFVVTDIDGRLSVTPVSLSEGETPEEPVDSDELYW